MTRTPEGIVKAWLKDEMLKEWPNLYFYSPPGGRFGIAGTPDHFYVCDGVFCAIEVKSSKGKATKLQMKRLNEIYKAGGVAALIYGKDYDKLDQIKSAIRLQCKK